VGDVVIEFKDTKAVGHNLLISYSFNTAFVDFNAYIIFYFRPYRIGLKDMSPLGKQKLSNFGSSFEVIIGWKQLCLCGEKSNAGCGLCKGVLKVENEKWERINAAIKVVRY
jgi:hypothetical protein